MTWIQTECRSSLPITAIPFPQNGSVCAIDLDRPPLTGGRPGGLAEEAVAADIALFDISEPLGRMYDLLVEDGNGVWWWGDGYPGLMEHPDFKR